MRVVHVLTSAATSWGGPPRAVRNLAAALNKLGVENTIVALGDRAVRSVEFEAPTKVRICGNALFGYAEGGNSMAAKMALPSSASFLRTLVQEVISADIVHLHELWSVPHVLGGVVARTIRQPFVLSPHGELTPWALQRRRALKRIAWETYEKRLLCSASGIHALTESEGQSLRKVHPRPPPVRVIPNGVDLAEIDKVIAPMQNPAGKRTSQFILYVGRLAAGKGLDVLLDAIGEVSRRMGRLSLMLVGPDELGLWPGLKLRASRLGILDQVKYLGVIDEPDKYAVYAAAGLYVLPSMSEGLSMSLLEALACGIPVVITRACNISQEELGSAGRVVELNPTSIAWAIIEMLQDESTYQRRREAARDLAERKYSSEVLARQMLEFYEDILSRAPKHSRRRR